jgi:tRNA-guanine family transglycosylase
MQSQVIRTSAGFSRIVELTINGKSLLTPTYFPAISSFGIKYPFRGLFRHFDYYPRVLISAYDWHLLPKKTKEKLSIDIGRFAKEQFLFLDSGVFEASWKKDKSWNHEKHSSVLSSLELDFHTSFDVPEVTTDNYKVQTDSIARSLRDCNKDGFLPIIHGGGPKGLLQIAKQLLENEPQLCNQIAIPERECGESIAQRAITIKKIRDLLDKLNPNKSSVLHILGCGDPISMLLFVYSGANSFDSLDWIKNAFDPDRLRLINFSHLELLNCDCMICNGVKKNYIEKVLMHNLWFYQRFVETIRTNIEENSFDSLIRKHFSNKLLSKIMRAR